MYIALPEDRFLVTRGFGEGRVEDAAGDGRGEITVAGLSFRCEDPFTSWTKRFRGAAQLVNGDALRAGPIGDGLYVPVSLDLECTMISPPFDYGSGSIEQSWAKAHYDQQQRVTGRLTIPGESFEIDGAGLRDHSWGPRTWWGMGATTWIHGQFLESGRSFMAIYVGDHPDYPDPISFTILSDGESVQRVGAADMPVGTNLFNAAEDTEFRIVMPDGSFSTPRVEVLAPMRMCLIGDTQFAFGTTHRNSNPIPSHDYVPAFARVEWNGEVGIGYIERTVRVK
jgi:hypothetical protein